MTKLNFRISSALKDIIGRDLITDDYIAIFELVKNSYDAHATKVHITFENIYDPDNTRIIIKDNGKGMDLNDLKDKWLFVAYSAKREGTEDKDYRDRIQNNLQYAGAKGIGRFSCDRLGKRLYLESTKLGGDRTEILETDWEEFEGSIRKEFIDIEVKHSWKKESSYDLKHGTVLIIDDLRSDWDREKLLKLKDSLAKLINPSKDKGDKKFTINIKVEEEKQQDLYESENHKIVNGDVENFIFETLGLKTTKIYSSISTDGKYITTELRDGGTLIYKITEFNKYDLLNNIDLTIYYLNRSAKLTFIKRMGLSSSQYGHIFLYKNGFRVYPYGEPGEDPLKIDVRKAQGHSRYLGTRELIGQIEIYSDTDQLKETSSRGDGLLKTKAYYQLEEFFWEVLKRLEKYVVDVQQWGMSIEDENSLDLKSRVFDLLAKLTGTEEIIDFETEENFLRILENSQYNSAETIVKNLQKIAFDSGDNRLIEQANKAASKLYQIQRAKEEAEKEVLIGKQLADKVKKELGEKESENLFLRSVKSQDFDEVISFLHHIGISAAIIDNFLTGIYNKLRRGQTIPSEKLLDILDSVVFENKKIQNISKFATKANFKLYTDAIEMNLDEYLKEYITNIVSLSTDEGLKVQFINDNPVPYFGKFRPIEINILIDNFLSNSKKAGATNFIVKLSRLNDKVSLLFIDNGRGIEKNKLDEIFKYGYTTNKEGSGIGLYHIKEIVKRIGGNLEVESELKKGTKFKLVL